MIGTESNGVRVAALGNLTAALVDALGQYADDVRQIGLRSGGDSWDSPSLGITITSDLVRTELITNGGLHMAWNVNGNTGQSGHTHSRQQAMVNRIVCAAMMTLA